MGYLLLVLGGIFLVLGIFLIIFHSWLLKNIFFAQLSKENRFFIIGGAILLIIIGLLLLIIPEDIKGDSGSLNEGVHIDGRMYGGDEEGTYVYTQEDKVRVEFWLIQAGNTSLLPNSFEIDTKGGNCNPVEIIDENTGESVDGDKDEKFMLEKEGTAGADFSAVFNCSSIYDGEGIDREKDYFVGNIQYQFFIGIGDTNSTIPVSGKVVTKIPKN